MDIPGFDGPLIFADMLGELVWYLNIFKRWRTGYEASLQRRIFDVNN